MPKRSKARVKVEAQSYLDLITKEAEMPSGATFKVKAMNGKQTIRFLELMPEEGLQDADSVLEFVKEHWDQLLDEIILPNIIEPEISADVITFSDAVAAFNEILSLTGLTGEEAERRESFRGQPSRKTRG